MTTKRNASEMALCRILEYAALGQSMNREIAAVLPDVSGQEISDLCKLASKTRGQRADKIVTFSPKVFIPLTRLCRDICGYCTFRQDPQNLSDLYMSPDAIIQVAEQGEKLGCTEALFTLGERPELKYPEARKWLDDRGFKSTLDYLKFACQLVLNETSLLPHANPGTMSHREMENLLPFNPSMGLMLESTSEKLYQSGGPHALAPSKRPTVRLKTLEIAGELGIPFTTGILVGIGESRRDRIDSLLELRRINRTYGNIQEVIIQNFRSKPKTPMQSSPDASDIEMLWTVATARILLGSEMNLQVPPNLSADNYEIYLEAGINDWGGVSPLTIDYVNPEAPWPQLADLQSRSASKGFELRPRLPIYPEFFTKSHVKKSEMLRTHIENLIDSDGYVKGGMSRYVATD